MSQRDRYQREASPELLPLSPPSPSYEPSPNSPNPAPNLHGPADENVISLPSPSYEPSPNSPNPAPNLHGPADEDVISPPSPSYEPSPNSPNPAPNLHGPADEDVISPPSPSYEPSSNSPHPTPNLHRPANEDVISPPSPSYEPSPNSPNPAPNLHGPADEDVISLPSPSYEPSPNSPNPAPNLQGPADEDVISPPSPSYEPSLNSPHPTPNLQGPADEDVISPPSPSYEPSLNSPHPTPNLHGPSNEDEQERRSLDWSLHTIPLPSQPNSADNYNHYRNHLFHAAVRSRADAARPERPASEPGAGPSSAEGPGASHSEPIQLSTEESNSSPTPTPDTTHPDEPPPKIRKLNCPTSPKCPKSPPSPKSPEEMDGETCPICLDSWENSGKHRLVALKCGHLFGDQCVQRWLKAQPLKNRCCPTCKSKANIKDIRYIYARRLVAGDTSQIITLQKQIETLKAEKNRTELELQKSKISYKAASMQLEILRSLMKSQTNKEQPMRKSFRFALEKNLEVCKDGGCRVLTYNYRTYELYVSQKNGNYLFPGYGIRKISCLDYKLGQFVYLHPKPIRDITYSQPRDLLLSVGLDSSARIVERGIPSVTVNTSVPLWSCSWDYLRSNEFYVGGVGGIIQQYDVRNPSNYIQTLTAPGDLSPVVSLCSTEFGLLSCQLNSCWLWFGSNRPLEPRALPIEGSFSSLCYDSDTHRALISTRPSSNGLERSKLTLCKLKGNNLSGEVLFDIEETFNGSARASLMSRPCWVKLPGASWVAAHSESDSALFLHGLDGSRTMSLPAAEPALDVACVDVNGTSILASLSESRLRIYKAVQMNT